MWKENSLAKESQIPLKLRHKVVLIETSMIELYLKEDLK